MPSAKKLGYMPELNTPRRKGPKPKPVKAEVPPGVDVPQWIVDQVPVSPSGKKRTKQQVAWFFKVLETGNFKQAAIDAGYAEHGVDWTVWRLKQEFGDLLAAALSFQRQWGKAKALRMFEYAMERAMDESNKDNPQMIAVGVRAAETLHARVAQVDESKSIGEAESSGEDDYGPLLDRLVEVLGAEAARDHVSVRGHKRFRDYLDRHYPVKQIEAGSP